MKEYMMNIVGAVLISVFAQVILPEKWNKYIKIITGLIIISAIVSPVKEFRKINFENYTYEAEKFNSEGENYTRELVISELSTRINNDIKTRISNEFFTEVDAKTTISVNKNNEISGISKIELTGKNINNSIITRLKEIYAPEEVLINGF